MALNAEDMLANVLEDFTPSREEREAAALGIAREVVDLAHRLGFRVSTHSGHRGEPIHTISYGSTNSGPSVFLSGSSKGVAVWRDDVSREDAHLVFMRVRKEWVGASLPDGGYRRPVDVVAELVVEKFKTVR